MNKPSFTIVPPTDEPDDPLAPARGIWNGVGITASVAILVLVVYKLWLAGPVGVVIIGIVGLVLLSPWGWRGRRGNGR